MQDKYFTKDYAGVHLSLSYGLWLEKQQQKQHSVKPEAALAKTKVE